MLDYDPVTNLNHYPASEGMRRYGLNPHDEPLYRVVFAPSRRYLVVGDVARWARLYGHLGNVWVMERWLPAEQFAKCTRDEWNRNLLGLGPWPDKGEYELCHVFDVSPPASVNIQQLITYIEAGREIPYSQTLAFAQKQMADEQKSIKSKKDSLIRNSLPAFGCRPFVGGRVHRGSKSAPILKTAQECGLPTTGGAYMGKRALQAIESAAA